MGLNIAFAACNKNCMLSQVSGGHQATLDISEWSGEIRPLPPWTRPILGSGVAEMAAIGDDIVSVI